MDGLSPYPYDLIVVGAGIVGATIADEARRRRSDARVLLLDRSHAGSGATRHSAALSTPTGATAAHRRLAERAERWYAALERTGEAPWRRRFDTYWVVPEEQVEEAMREFVADPPVPASAAELARLRDAHPDLVVRPYETVLRSGGVWAGAAEATARALAARLNRADGCGFWEGVQVDDVVPEDDGHTVLTRAGQRLRARHVVLATGPWLAGEACQAPAGWGLRVKKVAALHLARRPRAADPVVIFWDEDAFLLPLPERGVTLFSFYCPTWDVRPDDSALSIERAELDAALGVLAARSATLAATHAGGRAFCDGYLPDRLPAVAADPGRPGVVFAGGCSGSGFRLAPAVAELALSTLDSFAGD